MRYGLPYKGSKNGIALWIEIASTQKSVLSTANGDSGKVTEKLWTNPKTYARYGGICCDRQLTLF